MTSLETYYNKTYWLSEPNTPARKSEELIRVKFEDLPQEHKRAIEETLGYKLYLCNEAWNNLKKVILKSIAPQ